MNRTPLEVAIIANRNPEMARLLMGNGAEITEQASKLLSYKPEIGLSEVKQQHIPESSSYLPELGANSSLLANSNQILTHPDATTNQPSASWSVASPAGQVALAAVTGAALYKGGKYLYDAFQNYTGKEASQALINQAKELSDKTSKKLNDNRTTGLRALSGVVKLKSSTLTNQINNLYDQGNQNTPEYANLRNTLDQYTSLHQNIDNLLQKTTALRKLNAQLDTPGIKEHAVGAFIRECNQVNQDFNNIENDKLKLNLRISTKKPKAVTTKPKDTNQGREVTR